MNDRVGSLLLGLRLNAPIDSSDADDGGLCRAVPSDTANLRAMAYMYLGGATFGAFVVLLPHPHAYDVLGIFVLAVASYAVGGALLAWHRRLPPVSIDIALAAGVVMSTLALYFTRDGTGQLFSIFYVWSGLNSFYLLSSRRAAIQIGLIAACYAGYLGLTGVSPSHGAQRWMITVGTVSLAGILVGVLKGRVERLIVHLAETARRDPRTGFLNVTGFEELLDRELERAQRTSARLSVIACDIDRFKEVNDRLGHRAADEVLKAVGDVLERTKRRIDALARVSGQEFALLLPDTDEHGAYVLADRLRRAIRDAFAEGQVPITASLGLASFPKHGGTYEELLGAAGHAVYAAKELGRDRSVIYNAEIAANLRSQAVRDGMQSEEHLAAVLVLAETLDMRDTGTARHSETVGRYAKLLASELGMSPGEVERMHLAGMLHDIGKIGISDSILQKAGRLTAVEWEEMRKHPELGARILDGANLEDISAWVRAHHERPDGRGYPDALADEEIPLQAKILAVADAYEAMTTERVYKPGRSHEDAREELLRCAGSQFDPRVVGAFLNVLQAEPQDEPAKQAARGRQAYRSEAKRSSSAAAAAAPSCAADQRASSCAPSA